MKAASQPVLHAQEFARKAGVTVRALHHYDRLGLLKPSGRSRAGYRLYSEHDMVRLQQIVTLKFIGMSLKQIREILNRRDFNLTEALRAQRFVLEQQRLQLSAAIAALACAEQVASASATPDTEPFREIIEVIAMHNETEWSKVHERYFTEEQRSDMQRRTNPELAAEGTRKWMELIPQVEAAVKDGVDPASERARQLAKRWSELVNEFVQWASGPGSKISPDEVKSGLARMYSDRQNWPGGMKAPFSDEAQRFISKAQELMRK